MEEVTQRSRLKPRGMKAAGLHKSTLDDHADAVAHTRVARRAVNVVPLLPALQHLHRHWKRKTISLFSVHQTGIEVRVFVQLVARHCVLNLRTRRPAICIEIRTALRNELGLIMHVLPAAERKHRGNCSRSNGYAPGGLFHLRINDPPPPRRPQGTAQGTY